jgi:hypothetical protein
MSFTSQLGITK